MGRIGINADVRMVDGTDYGRSVGERRAAFKVGTPAGVVPDEQVWVVVVVVSSMTVFSGNGSGIGM